MRLKNLFLLVIFGLSIIILGINGCPSTAPTTNTAGLTMSFVKDAPPVSVAVGKEFPIYADVLNKGGEFINKGQAKFYLSGLGPNFENVKLSTTNNKTLAKESAYPDRIYFAEKAKFTFPLQGILVVPFVLTSCYDYSGRAQATICVSGSNESKICKLSGEKITSNTAGPIQVASLTEILNQNKLTLVLDIVNKGTGQVYLSDTDCDKLEAKDFSESLKQGKLNIHAFTRDNFKCKLQTSGGQIEGLEGMVTLGKVVCEKDISNEDYSSAFTVEVRYKYRDSISQSINIVP